MRTTLLTLSFSRAEGRFVDEPLRQLLAQEPESTLREHLLAVDGSPYLLCVVTHVGSAVARPCQAPAANGREPRPAPPLQDVLQGLDDDQRRLFERIRKWRNETAKNEGVPPYVVLTNRQLVAVVERRPGSRTALGEVAGLGDKKIRRYGEGILALCAPQTEASEASL
jgi:superfamily II DNA helicase RecQ